MQEHRLVAAHVVALALLGAAGDLLGQTLPPTAPTMPSASGASPVPSHALPASRTPERVARRAEVIYAAGRLQVNADNSSLNQILREIGRVTGMKITGGVAEEQVFGSYGPADPSAVLSMLLDGTGCNMLLRFNSARVPAELVLTPRQGGPTPPNPNASNNANREDDLPPERRPGSPQQGLKPASAPNPFPSVQAPTAAVPQPATESPANSTPGSETTVPESPNGVKTPQQIYDQLIKMQQQAQKPPQ